MIQAVHRGDPRLDSYRHVGDPSWLLEHRLLVAEGRLVVERLLVSPRFELDSIVVTPAARTALAAQLSAADCDVYVCERALLEEITGFNFHRGCLGLARRPQARSAAELLRARRLLALEGIGNPDNVGGLFRTAAALGAGGVLLDPDSGDPFYRKAIRTSMAATLSVPWMRLETWPHGLEQFRQGGFRIVALTPDSSALPLDDFARESANDRLMLALGSEGAGLSQRTLALADVCVRIPIARGVDSLNVSVAAGIALSRLKPHPADT